MSDLRTAAEEVLEAIDRALPHAPYRGEFDALADMADALRAALEEPVQEPVVDAARVIEWATGTPRKAAVHAFTEGPERQAAYWIEWAEARVVNQRLTTEPVAWMDIARDGTRLSVRMWSDGNFEEVPLYTVPRTEQEPLADMAVFDLADALLYGGTNYGVLAFARAIERAHGIGGGNE